jgi:hypothetical protein
MVWNIIRLSTERHCQWWRILWGKDFSLITGKYFPIQPLLYLDVSASIANPISVGKELQIPSSVLHCVVSGDTPSFFCA